MRTREHLVWAAAAIGSVALIGAITNAGDLNPPAGEPGPTMHTLEEIYDATAVSAFGAASAVPGAFGGPTYLELIINGNPIPGEDIVEGTPEVIQVFGFFESVTRPFDASTGGPLGIRQHEPVRFRKRVDRGSPLIAKALTNNEIVTSARFRFFRPDPGSGMNVHYFTVLLEDAIVVSYTIDSTGSSNPSTPLTETVEIVFQSITWTYEEGGIEHTDNWTSLSG